MYLRQIILHSWFSKLTSEASCRRINGVNVSYVTKHDVTARMRGESLSSDIDQHFVTTHWSVTNAARDGGGSGGGDTASHASDGDGVVCWSSIESCSGDG